jgi:hypothetical protein
VEKARLLREHHLLKVLLLKEVRLGVLFKRTSQLKRKKLRLHLTLLKRLSTLCRLLTEILTPHLLSLTFI